MFRLNDFKVKKNWIGPGYQLSHYSPYQSKVLIRQKNRWEWVNLSKSQDRIRLKNHVIDEMNFEKKVHNLKVFLDF